MYLGIDVGGTKTLLAVFSQSGEIHEKAKFPTPPQYEQFLTALDKILSPIKDKYQIKFCCCAAAGYIDRKRGIATRFGNLAWHNAPLKDDIGRILGGIPVVVENDAKLAGLSEALLVRNKYNKVLYITIGTGIGDGIIINGMIDPNLADSEAGQMAIEHEGELYRWEDLASGRAIMNRYGKKAQDIEDPKIWAEYAAMLAKGVDILVAVLQPEVVIIGGGVGTHFKKFGTLLGDELKKLENHMVKMPPVIQAKRPEEAVIYGCYDFIKQQS